MLRLQVWHPTPKLFILKAAFSQVLQSLIGLWTLSDQHHQACTVDRAKWRWPCTLHTQALDSWGSLCGKENTHPLRFRVKKGEAVLTNVMSCQYTQQFSAAQKKRRGKWISNASASITFNQLQWGRVRIHLFNGYDRFALAPFHPLIQEHPLSFRHKARAQVSLNNEWHVPAYYVCLQTPSVCINKLEPLRIISNRGSFNTRLWQIFRWCSSTFIGEWLKINMLLLLL